MADSQYSYFYGIVHPPGKKDASEVVNIADDMTHDQVKDLDLVDYAITEGHPPNGESITKHANLVRGRVVHQYMDQQGNKVIMGKLMHNGMSGIRTRYRIESGSNASLSLGHTVRPVEDENNNVSLKFLGDHIAIVDEPRRPGCHIHGMVRPDRIDREKVTSRIAQLMNKVPTDRLAQQQQSANSAPVAMDAQLQGVAAAQAAAPTTNASNLPIPGAVPMQQQQQQQQQQQSEPDLSRDQLLVAAINAAEEAKATRAELERLRAERAEEQRVIQEREAARRQQEREKKEKATRETESIMVEYIRQAAASGDAAAKAAVEKYDAMPGGVAKALYDSDEVKREEGLDMWNGLVMCAGMSFTNQTNAQNQRVQELMHKRARESDVHQFATNKRPMISEWSTASGSSSAAAVAPPSSSMMGASSSSTSTAPTTRNIQQERQDLMMDITRYAHSAGYVQAAVKSGGGGMNRFYESAYKHAMPKPKPAFIRK